MGMSVPATSTESAPPSVLQSIIASLEGLSSVEETITSKFVSDANDLSEIPRYLLQLGGKRIRPVLSLLTAKAFGLYPYPNELIDVAAGIELIHMATLLHDDIIDRSLVRRHKESALVKFGMPKTLLAGDFLLVRAFSLCARLDTYIIDATEKACIELTEGEILETPLYVENHSLESSLKIALKKTASLFRLSTEVAAHLARLHPEVITHLAKFGESLGLAFQILDDLLDVTSDTNLLGKEAGTDLRERKPSVVNVKWLATGDKLAEKLLKEPAEDTDKEFVDSALASLKNSKVVQEVRALAISYAEHARRSLLTARELTDAQGKSGELLINPEALMNLEQIIDFTVSRVL